MRYIGLIAPLLLAAAAFGQFPDDESLARKGGLSLADVKVLRTNLGIPATDTRKRITAIDGDSLKSNGHILVVEITQGVCMQLHVVERMKLTEVWSLKNAPSRSWPLQDEDNGATKGICPQSSLPAKAYGKPDGRIILELPVRNDPFQRSVPAYIYSYSWDGSTYKLESEH